MMSIAAVVVATVVVATVPVVMVTAAAAVTWQQTDKRYWWHIERQLVARQNSLKAQLKTYQFIIHSVISATAQYTTPLYAEKSNLSYWKWNNINPLSSHVRKRLKQFQWRMLDISWKDEVQNQEVGEKQHC